MFFMYPIPVCLVWFPLEKSRKWKVGLSLSQEMSTSEHFNTTTNITISVSDGDDQYPQFVPCTLLFQDEISQICTNPVYSVNVTEGEEVSR